MTRTGAGIASPLKSLPPRRCDPHIHSVVAHLGNVASMIVQHRIMRALSGIHTFLPWAKPDCRIHAFSTVLGWYQQSVVTLYQLSNANGGLPWSEASRRADLPGLIKRRRGGTLTMGSLPFEDTTAFGQLLDRRDSAILDSFCRELLGEDDCMDSGSLFRDITVPDISRPQEVSHGQVPP